MDSETAASNPYEAKLEARKARMLARAAALRAQADSRIGTARQLLANVPLGQPIRTGATIRDRMESSYGKAFAAQKEAAQLEHAASRVGTAGISKDDPDCIAKLTAELAEKQAAHEQLKRAKDPKFRITNSAANIRRIKARIAELSSVRS